MNNTISIPTKPINPFEGDCFNLKSFADNLKKLLIFENDIIGDESYVLSLNSNYGTGKSTFLQMFYNYLVYDGFEVISINAWKTDYSDEPMVPIASEILKHINKQKNQKLVNALNRVLGVLAITLNSAASFSTAKAFTPTDAIKTFEDLQKAPILEKLGGEYFEAFNSKEKALTHLQKCLQIYADNVDKKPLIIIVDELDRTGPGYAIHFLETIKHIFAVKGICFILAIDKEQLESSVMTLFGPNLKFSHYYSKFIHREFDLPYFNEINYTKLCDKFTNKYLTVKTSQLFNDNTKSAISSYMAVLSKSFSLRPREIEKTFNQLRFFFSDSTIEKNTKVGWCRATCLAFALKSAEPTLANTAIQNPNNTLNILVEVFNKYGLTRTIKDARIIEFFLFSATEHNFDTLVNHLCSIVPKYQRQTQNNSHSESRQAVSVDLYNFFITEFSIHGLPEISIFNTILEKSSTLLKLLDK